MPLRFVAKQQQQTCTSNSVITLNISPGNKITSLVLEFLTSGGALVTEAQLRAEITEIRLTINGNEIIRNSPTRILDLYEALGTRVGVPAAIGGVIELNLGPLLYKSPADQEVFGWGTEDVTTIQVQVTCGTLSAIASVRGVTEKVASKQNLGSYIKFLRINESFNSTGDHTVDRIPRVADTTYLLFMVHAGASGVIETSRLMLNEKTVREDIKPATNAQFMSNKGLVQPSGYFIHNLTDGSITSGMPMVGATDLRVITNFSTAPGAAGYDISYLGIVAQTQPSV